MTLTRNAVVIMLLWVTSSSAQFDSFTYPVLVNDQGTVDSDVLPEDQDIFPSLLKVDGGPWVVVWRGSGNVLSSSSYNNGATWTPSTEVRASGVQTSPDLATDNSGVLIAVWDGAASGDVELSRSLNNGASWGALTALDGGGTDLSPALAASTAGTWILVWRSDGVGRDIVASRSTDSGVVWSAPVLLNSGFVDTSNDRQTAVATDNHGTWVAVWSSAEDIGGALDSDPDLVFARSVDDGMSWSVPAAVDTLAATDTGDDLRPRITTDGKNRWMIVWESDDDRGSTVGPDPDIFVAISNDNGASFGTSDVLNTNAAFDQADRTPQIATDGTGTWVATWQTKSDIDGVTITLAEDHEIAFSYSLDDGLIWSEPRIVNRNAAADTERDSNPTIATDTDGIWVVVWNSDDPIPNYGSDDDVFAATTLISFPAMPIRLDLKAVFILVLLVPLVVWRFRHVTLRSPET